MEHNGAPPTTGSEAPGDAPLALLAELPHPTSDQFLPRVRARIERRLLVSSVAAGFWFVPFTVILEFLSLALDLLNPRRDSPPRSRAR